MKNIVIQILKQQSTEKFFKENKFLSRLLKKIHKNIFGKLLKNI